MESRVRGRRWCADPPARNRRFLHACIRLPLLLPPSSPAARRVLLARRPSRARRCAYGGSQRPRQPQGSWCPCRFLSCGPAKFSRHVVHCREYTGQVLYDASQRYSERARKKTPSPSRATHSTRRLAERERAAPVARPSTTAATRRAGRCAATARACDSRTQLPPGAATGATRAHTARARLFSRHAA